MVTVHIPAQFNFLAPISIDGLVRMGSKNDGGYVVPRIAIDNAECLLSFGLSDNWSFDEQFLRENPKVTINAYDHTVSMGTFFVKATAYIVLVLAGKRPFVLLKNRFFAIFKYATFFKKEGGPKHYKERVCNIKSGKNDATIDEIFERVATKNVFLKCDIEGDEYGIMGGILDQSSKIICIAIEFHDINKSRLVFEQVVKKIQDTYEIVHLHANNFGGVSADGLPDALEITFLRKDLCPVALNTQRSTLPLEGLDEKSFIEKPDFRLEFTL